MELSIIIVNWNTRQLLLDCLNSIYQRFFPFDYEVLVVDNASTDGSVAAVQKNFPQVRLFDSPKNLGFGRGNNLAASSARGRYLLLLNPDTLVLSEVIPKTLDYLKKNQNVGLVSCRLREDLGGAFQGSSGNFPSLCNMFRQNLVCAFLKYGGASWGRRLATLFRLKMSPLREMYPLWNFQQVTEVDWVMGAYMMMSRQLFSEVGFFDETFLLFGEDIDLCRKVHLTGKKVVYFGEDEIIHLGGRSTKDIPVISDAAHYVGMFRYYAKHNGSLSQWAYRAVVYFSALLGLVSLRLKRREKTSDNVRLQNLRYKTRMKVAIRPTYDGLISFDH